LHVRKNGLGGNRHVKGGRINELKVLAGAVLGEGGGWGGGGVGLGGGGGGGGGGVCGGGGGKIR